MSSDLTISIPRNAQAKLVLVFDDGETIPATEEHLRQLGYVNARDTYFSIETVLQEVTGTDDLSSGRTNKANLIRYLVETGVVWCIDHFDQENRDELRELLKEEGTDG